MCRRHVTGLIHGAAAGVDGCCIYLESFSFSLRCTIEYTHMILPNFHIVTYSQVEKIYLMVYDMYLSVR
jgi:hypothetical protein